ncbi:carbonic anhydrase [Hyphomicrobium sp.]|uniref:carbonic anhydrase n=1 Tax=Hyphomicrobium sp. TaxID=82 RepID=UPI002FE37D66
MTTSKDTSGVDLDIKDAIEGHERFRRAFEREEAFYKTLATEKQTPRLLWIGCCDSRVVPSQIMQADPGELFEVRNIANCVPPAWADDEAVGAAIEYALAHLGIDDIVVCGHTGCGGIAALAGPVSPGRDAHLARWVEYTRPAHRLVAAARVPDGERSLATIRAHIQFQLDNLMTYESVARGVADGRIGIHGWLYDMEAGEIQAYDPKSGAWQGLLDRAE